MSEKSLTIKRELESNPRECVTLIRQMLAGLESFGWTQQDVFGIHMAIEEAVMNAIKHGNKEDSDKKVQVEIEIDVNNFYAKISDQGCGFCMEEVPDPTLEENLEKTSGRGVMLIKNFVDDCKYNEVGNSVELRKSKTTE